MAREVQADLTWTGASFERNVRLAVDDDGRIAAVERAGAEAGSPGEEDASVTRLPGRALLPGFVNAHSHAFQRGLRGRGETFPAGAGSFWTWREAMYELVEALDRERFRVLCRDAFREMRSAGITTVGEFHYLHHADPAAKPPDFALDEVLLEAAAEAGIRLVLLQTCYLQGGPGRPLEAAQRRFRAGSVDTFLDRLDTLEDLLDPATQSLGIVAHSIRAVPPEAITTLWDEAERRDVPFHVHVEEQVREIVECARAYRQRPMELLLERLELSGRFTAVHCTHTDPADMARYGGTGASVCLCPTTEANLGDGIADLPGILAAGAPVCLGTDSNARISMLDEARWLELVQRLARERRGVARDPDDPAGRVAPALLAAATRNGARALGLEAGEIRPGAWADLVAVDLEHPELAGWTEDTLLESILLGAGERVIAGTCVGGRWDTEP
ncbi:MAG: formimidoylglutamate deiminase [Thermoanaerobaculia bacterium]